jgi:uncharacterized damage-inducible protein DinB
MPENRENLIRHYLEMRQALLAVVDALPPEAVTARVVDGWTVADHLNHIAAWDDLRASEVVRISAGYEAICRMDDTQGDVYSTLMYALRKPLPIEQVRWELDQSHRRLLDAIASATDTGLDGSRYGEAGLRSSHEAQHTTWLMNYRGAQ